MSVAQTQPTRSNLSDGVFPLAQMLLRLCLLIGIVASTFTLLSGDKGLVQNYLLAQQIATTQLAIAEHRAANEQLARVLTSLREDMDMVEYIARHELRMARPDEVLFDLPIQASQQ